MSDRAQLLEVLGVFETKRVVHGAHESEATKAGYVAPKVGGEDVLHPVGWANLGPDGELQIQLKAFPLTGRLVIRLPRG